VTALAAITAALLLAAPPLAPASPPAKGPARDAPGKDPDAEIVENLELLERLELLDHLEVLEPPPEKDGSAPEADPPAGKPPPARK
jgi:hypothetical protein